MLNYMNQLEQSLLNKGYPIDSNKYDLVEDFDINNVEEKLLFQRLEIVKNEILSNVYIHGSFIDNDYVIIPKKTVRGVKIPLTHKESNIRFSTYYIANLHAQFYLKNIKVEIPFKINSMEKEYITIFDGTIKELINFTSELLGESVSLEQIATHLLNTSNPDKVLNHLRYLIRVFNTLTEHREFLTIYSLLVRRYNDSLKIVGKFNLMFGDTFPTYIKLMKKEKPIKNWSFYKHNDFTHNLVFYTKLNKNLYKEVPLYKENKVTSYLSFYNDYLTLIRTYFKQRIKSSINSLDELKLVNYLLDLKTSEKYNSLEELKHVVNMFTFFNNSLNVELSQNTQLAIKGNKISVYNKSIPTTYKSVNMIIEYLEKLKEEKGVEKWIM